MKQRPAFQRVHLMVLVGWAVFVVALVAIGMVLVWEGGGPFDGESDIGWAVVVVLWGGLAVVCGGMILAVAWGVARFALAGSTSRTVFLVLAPPLITLAVIGTIWGWPWSH